MPILAIRNPAHKTVPGLLGDKRFREGFAVLARMGLTFDAWLYHPQIGELTDLARAFPEARIVMDHVGGPIGIGAYAGKHQEILPGWKTSIKALAACPNVHVKLGGLGMRMGGFTFHEPADPPSSETLAETWRPYIETCIEAFGASRCMFESNFPVDKGSYSYPVFWNACKLLAKGASAAEKADLFAGTAKRFYRLDCRRWPPAYHLAAAASTGDARSPLYWRRAKSWLRSRIVQNKRVSRSLTTSCAAYLLLPKSPRTHRSLYKRFYIFRRIYSRLCAARQSTTEARTGAARPP